MNLLKAEKSFRGSFGSLLQSIGFSLPCKGEKEVDSLNSLYCYARYSLVCFLQILNGLFLLNLITQILFGHVQTSKIELL